MIAKLAKNQNWAKACPWLGIVAAALLLALYRPSQAMFWALLNIPLYLFHQTEEHYWPGGFKRYMNEKIYKLPKGEEQLSDAKIFWINILLVWVAFTIFGALAFANIGFGLVIVVFSIINCVTHIAQGIFRRGWNPGLVMAGIQFILSIYAAWFITANALANPVAWWIGAVAFAGIVHGLLFKVVMAKKQ